MPICPGCEQTVSYDRLDIHERYCEGIWSRSQARNANTERLERRLVALEELVDGRLKSIETALEGRRTNRGGDRELSRTRSHE